MGGLHIRMGVIACKNSDGHKRSSSSRKLLISAQVSIFPQLIRLSIDKGRVIVNYRKCLDKISGGPGAGRTSKGRFG